MRRRCRHCPRSRGPNVEAGQKIREEIGGVGFVGQSSDPLGRPILYPCFLWVDPTTYWVDLFILGIGPLDRPTKTCIPTHEPEAIGRPLLLLTLSMATVVGDGGGGWLTRVMRRREASCEDELQLLSCGRGFDAICLLEKICIGSESYITL
jgi:hypothetical protein